MPKVLTRLRIDEVSAVDRGAGEGVKIVLHKRKADMPKNEPTYSEKLTKFFSDLFGKSEKVVPADLVANATAKLAESVNSIVKHGGADTSLMLGKTFAQFQEHLSKAVTAGGAVDKTADDPAPKKKGHDMDTAALKKALGLKDDAGDEDILKAITTRDEELAKAKAKLDPDEEKEDADEKDSKKRDEFRAMTHEQRKAYMAKKNHTDLPADVKKALEERDEMKKRLDALEAKDSLAEFTKRAVDAGLPASEGATLQKAYGSGNKEAVDKLLQTIKAANAQAVAAGFFKEIGGTGNGNTGTTAVDELNAKAAEYRKTHPELTQEQAFAKVYVDPVNVELAKRERRENRPA